MNGVFFMVFYIIPLVILPWFTNEYDYMSYSNVQVDIGQMIEGDGSFKYQIPERSSTHPLDI